MTQGGKACFFQEAGPGEKRAAILAAAMEIFSRDGFHKARVEDIAAQAGVGKGTVYEYFRGKQDLYQEMFHVGVDSYLKRIQRVVGQAGVYGNACAVSWLHCDYLDISSQIMRLMTIPLVGSRAPTGVGHEPTHHHFDPGFNSGGDQGRGCGLWIRSGGAGLWGQSRRHAQLCWAGRRFPLRRRR